MNDECLYPTFVTLARQRPRPFLWYQWNLFPPRVLVPARVEKYNVNTTNAYTRYVAGRDGSETGGSMIASSTGALRWVPPGTTDGHSQSPHRFIGSPSQAHWSRLGGRRNQSTRHPMSPPPKPTSALDHLLSPTQTPPTDMEGRQRLDKEHLVILQVT